MTVQHLAPTPQRPAAQRTARPLLILIGPLGLVLTLVSVRYLPQTSDTWVPLSLLLGGAALLLSVVQSRATLTPLNAYMLVVMLFSLSMAPLLLVPAAYYDALAVRTRRTDWILYDAEFSLALGLVCVFLWALVAAASVELLLGPRRRAAPEMISAEALGLVGAVVTVGAVLAWLASCVSAAGPRFFALDYASFQELTETPLTSFLYNLPAFGAALAAVSKNRYVRVWTLSALALFSLLALPVGLRGPVMMPLLTYVVVVGLRRPLRMRWWWFALVLAALSAIAAIKSLRTVGLAGVNQGLQIATSPLDALHEMGTSLRPVVLAIMWHDQWGQTPGGILYWTPFSRLLARLFGLPRPPALSDPNLFNVVIRSREGSIGGSVIGEAYYAGGLAFVVLVGLAIGFLLAVSRRQATTPASMAVLGCLFASLVMMARNAFTPAAMYALITIGLIAIAAGAHVLLKALQGKDPP